MVNQKWFKGNLHSYFKIITLNSMEFWFLIFVTSIILKIEIHAKLIFKNETLDFMKSLFVSFGSLQHLSLLHQEDRVEEIHPQKQRCLMKMMMNSRIIWIKWYIHCISHASVNQRILLFCYNIFFSLMPFLWLFFQRGRLH